MKIAMNIGYNCVKKLVLIEIILMNQSLKLVKETNGNFNFDAPCNAGISKIQKLAVTEVPSIFEIRSSAAFNVPPVANRSSTINTFAPEGRLSFYISQTSLLYSVPYSCL